MGPASAYAELFGAPLPSGPIGRWVMAVTAKGSSVYDTFPSLHVLITCVLLAHDWFELRRRFWIMAGPALGLLVSTVYLRYHYGVDILVVAGMLFLGLWQTVLKPRGRTVTSTT